MSRTTKLGKRGPRRIKSKPETPKIGNLRRSRQSWGSTERILRRNARKFKRLANKNRRSVGKKIIEETPRE